jgi:hypothetical protein
MFFSEKIKNFKSFEIVQNQLQNQKKIQKENMELDCDDEENFDQKENFDKEEELQEEEEILNKILQERKRKNLDSSSSDEDKIENSETNSENDSGNEFQVEKIVGIQLNQANQVKFQVKWRDYEKSTLEPYENVEKLTQLDAFLNYVNNLTRKENKSKKEEKKMAKENKKEKKLANEKLAKEKLSSEKNNSSFSPNKKSKSSTQENITFIEESDWKKAKEKIIQKLNMFLEQNAVEVDGEFVLTILDFDQEKIHFQVESDALLDDQKRERRVEFFPLEFQAIL